MRQDEFLRALERVCHEALGDGSLGELARLSGGANMESWSLRYGARRLVLRRHPGGVASAGDLDAISLDAQAELIEAARRAGVSAPAVLARLEPRHGLGEGFLMAHVDGEALPHRILGKPAYATAEAGLVRQCARELARIHSLDPATLPGELRYRTPVEAVREQERRYRALGGRLPVFDFAFGWLQRHAPAPTAPVLLHGDFRMGNLMIDATGIVAVLDWELAHLGDPAQDLAYLCTPSWRFGRYDRPVGGFGQVEALLDAYRAASGRDVDAPRLHWWLVYGTLWWGLVCLAMGQMWRSGTDRSLERAVIGRRVSEVEIDLLLLFDEAAGADLAWESPEEESGAGEIGCQELLAALGEWVQTSVQPDARGHALFEARVAGNALGIARRQAAWGSRFAQAAVARLAGIGLDEAALCRALRDERIALREDAVWRHLRLRALERLAIDQPAYAGLRHARARWLESAPDIV